MQDFILVTCNSAPLRPPFKLRILTEFFEIHCKALVSDLITRAQLDVKSLSLVTG